MRFMDLGPAELLLIVVALVLVFGAGKLGEIGGALGRSVREFKSASEMKEEHGPSVTDEPAPPALPPATPAPAAIDPPLRDYRPG